MKNKGFTLIELLAVIIILSIIALIVTPTILSTIDNTEKESLNRSVEMYQRAVQTAILNYEVENKRLPKGFVELEMKKNVENNSDVYCAKRNIKPDGSFYLAQCYVDGKLVEDYKYGTPFCTLTDMYDEDGTAITNGYNYDIGDMVTCGTESFYIISEVTEDSQTIELIPQYNLNLDLNNPIQSESAGMLAFSSTNYWYAADTATYNEGYSEGGLIYDQNSLLYPYVEAYERYLFDLGLFDVTATLISKSKVDSLGCSGTGCTKSFMNSTGYWLSDIKTDNSVYVIGKNGIRGTSGYGAAKYGIRPIIIVDISEI